MRKNLFFFLLSLVFTTAAWAEGYDVVNTGKKTRADRNVTTLKLNSIYASYPGNTVNLTAEEYGMAYADLTQTAKMKAAAGETVTMDVTYRGSWMHGYLFIDADGDNAFTSGVADDGFTPTGDLVSYSNASPNESTWFNSKGTSDSNSTHVLPSFVTPTTPGTYRMRYMLDWNSIDPTGSTEGFMTNGGVIIDVMLEVTGSYDFSVGEQVTSLADIKADGAYLLKYDAMAAALNEYTGPASDLYVALASNTKEGYEKAADVTVKSLTQFIPTENENEYIIYQPIMGTYFGDAGRLNNGYNGVNGWQYAYNEVRVAQPMKLTDAGNGEFYISYVLDEYYKDGVIAEDDKNVDVWVGLEMRGGMKIFPKDEFERLDAQPLDGTGDYTGGSFGLPVDFKVKIVKAEGVKEVLEVKTVADVEREQLEAVVKQVQPLADEKYQFVFTNNPTQAQRIDLTAFPTALEAAQALVDAKSQDAAAIRAAKETLETESVKYGYYILQFASVEANEAKYEWTTSMEAGKYPGGAKADLLQLNSDAKRLAVELCTGTLMNPVVVGTPATAVSHVATIYAAFEAFWAWRFPETFDDLFVTRALPAGQMVNIADAPDNDDNADDNGDGHKNQKTRTSLYLKDAVEGIRVTVLRNIPGNSSNNGMLGNYPMVALGEMKVYDADGLEVELSESNFAASAVADNEGFECGVARLCDGDWSGAGSYFHSPWSGSVSEYVWFDITFPSAMKAFSIEFISRDLSTNGGTLSLYPDSIALTPVGEQYDPMVFTENVYNATLGEQVTDLSQITEDGLYVLQGLLNTHPVYGQNDEGDVKGVAHYYTDTRWFHKSVVREKVAFRIKKSGDKYTIQSLATGKYWPSVATAGGAMASSTADADKAAQLSIVPLTGDKDMVNTFAIYEEHKELKKDILHVNEADSAYSEVATPYVVYMDWNNGLATRATQSYLPGVGKNFAGKDIEVLDAEEDAWGDSLHFNKKNGEGQWKIYKLTMDTPDYYLLQGLAESYGEYGYRVGTHPGHVSKEDSTNVADAIEAALNIVDDETLVGDAKNAASVKAVNGMIAAVKAVKQVPVEAGKEYVLISGLDKYYEKQGNEMGIYAEADDDATVIKWKAITGAKAADEFVWTLEAVEATSEAVKDLNDEEKAAAYIIKHKVTGAYIGVGANDNGNIANSNEVVSAEKEDAQVYVVKNVTGKSTFNLSPVGLLGSSLHTDGHSDGAGKGSNLVYWYNDPLASQWYIVDADYDVLSDIDDLFAEGDELLSVTYYTVGGAASSTPVKGINIVKMVYVNGVVETKKVLVK